MRLIDAEKLRQKDINGNMVDIFDVLEAPTVKAIPIKFIEEQIEKATDINNKDELDLLYAGNLSYLLKLWENENEEQK